MPLSLSLVTEVLLLLWTPLLLGPSTVQIAWHLDTQINHALAKLAKARSSPRHIYQVTTYTSVRNKWTQLSQPLCDDKLSQTPKVPD